MMLSRNFNLTEPSISFVRSPVMWFYKVAAGIIPDSKKNNLTLFSTDAGPEQKSR